MRAWRTQVGTAYFPLRLPPSSLSDLAFAAHFNQAPLLVEFLLVIVRYEVTNQRMEVLMDSTKMSQATKAQKFLLNQRLTRTAELRK